MTHPSCQPKSWSSIFDVQCQEGASNCDGFWGTWRHSERFIEMGSWLYSVNRGYTWFLDIGDGFALLALIFWPNLSLLPRVLLLVCWTVLLSLHVLWVFFKKPKPSIQEGLVSFQICLILLLIVGSITSNSIWFHLVLVLSLTAFLGLFVARKTRVKMLGLGGHAVVSSFGLPVVYSICNLLFLG